MSVSAEFAKAHVMRLAKKPGWPQDLAGIRALVEAVQNHAPSEEHVKTCIDNFSLHSDRCPEALEIISELAETIPGRPNRHAGCLACGGTGFVLTEIGELTGAAPCPARPPAPEGEQA